jgi:hypothetical protein
MSLPFATSQQDESHVTIKRFVGSLERAEVSNLPNHNRLNCSIIEIDTGSLSLHFTDSRGCFNVYIEGVSGQTAAVRTASHTTSALSLTFFL